jgi:hypothetical protein
MNHNDGQKHLHMFLFRSDLMTEFTQSSFHGSETAIVYDDCINYMTLKSVPALQLVHRAFRRSLTVRLEVTKEKYDLAASSLHRHISGEVRFELLLSSRPGTACHRTVASLVRLRASTLEILAHLMVAFSQKSDTIEHPSFFKNRISLTVKREGGPIVETVEKKSSNE